MKNHGHLNLALLFWLIIICSLIGWDEVFSMFF